MSYHVQQNTQQRSLGIFIVIAFHVLLIWGLANGLGTAISKFIAPEAIKITPTPKQTTPPPIELPSPVIPKTTTVTVEPTELPVVVIDDTEPPQVIGKANENIAPPVGPTISKPTLKNATKPVYPAAAARLSEEGTTGLQLYITADGHVGDVQVFSSSGSSRLDEAAVKHAKRNWLFSACTENGKAVGCWYKANLVWRLEDAAR